MTASTTQKKRVWITFILVAFVGVSILTYQFINFDSVPSLRQVTKKNNERLQPWKSKKTHLAECNAATNRKILLKNSSKPIGNTFKYNFTKIPNCVNKKIEESICKHSLYWSKAAFTSSWKEMIQPCLG